jgi:Fe-S cluster biogenesis protein NfuA
MEGAKREFSRRTDRIEELVSRIENTGDPAFRAVAQELLQAVIELHGVALDRILQAVNDLPQGSDALVRIAGDELVSSVLSLHGIHPVPVEVRVAGAIEKTQPYLHSHGGSVELASVEDGEVHVRLQGACGTCNSSSDTLKSRVESEIYQAAPEVVSVVAESMPASSHPQLVVLQTH